jgi:hypothetical protein
MKQGAPQTPQIVRCGGAEKKAVLQRAAKGISSGLVVRGPDDFGIANLCLESFYFLALITAMSAAPWNWHSMTRLWPLRRQVLDFIVSCLFAVVVLAPTMLFVRHIDLGRLNDPHRVSAGFALLKQLATSGRQRLNGLIARHVFSQRNLPSDQVAAERFM